MKRYSVMLTVACVVVMTVSFISSGCHKAVTAVNESKTLVTLTLPDGEEVVVKEHLKGGAKMWEDNCMRCHNLRPPRERSDREWDLIVHQMRVRAHLTGEEHREILKFLQAAN